MRQMLLLYGIAQGIAINFICPIGQMNMELRAAELRGISISPSTQARKIFFTLFNKHLFVY